MRVLHRGASDQEKLQARLESEPVPVAVGGDRLALDQLHHQVGDSFLGRAAVEEASDVGMLEGGEDLPLDAQARPEELRIGSCPHELHCDLVLVFLVDSLRAVDFSHPAGTDFLQQPVGAEPPSCILVGGRRRFEQCCRGTSQKAAAGVLIGPQERFELGAKCGVACAQAFEIAGARRPAQ